ncbi:MAG: peptidoglycan DD-metalloendopeptidase family protein [Cyanobacteria bacterium NC_groundwater_1444_Ag_S-0.65um_54_12]|nr:peptidoglycan DD-metalloendopeptidase family protein [Cyanobacteria bacterium NC_groundwater_1444_Ag_S-0.65um_54_12]
MYTVPLEDSSDGAMNIGTYRYAESGQLLAPRRARIKPGSIFSKHFLLRLLPLSNASSRISHADSSLPAVGCLNKNTGDLRVFHYEPALFSSVNLQKYRKQRRCREERISRFVVSGLALFLMAALAILVFARPDTQRRQQLPPLAYPAKDKLPATVAVEPKIVKPGLNEPEVINKSALPVIYEVKNGDTLGAIALRYGVKLPDMLTANKLSKKSTLQIGQKLFIPQEPTPGVEVLPRKIQPAVTSVSDRTAVTPVLDRTYKVRAGDFPEIIARRFGLQPRTLLFANKLDAAGVLQIGQILKIPPADGYYHAVSKGETLKKLLGANRINREVFYRFNPGAGTTLRRGQIIFLPGEVPNFAGRVREGRQRGYRKRDRRSLSHRGIWGDVSRALSDTFQWPLASHAISSRFGERGADWHPGIDITAKIGTPIRAARSGKVTYAGWEGRYGRMVDIDHGKGMVTRYAHAARILVRSGEQVQAGDIIGTVGVSGNATGPHLHYEIRINGRAVNPGHVY